MASPLAAICGDCAERATQLIGSVEGKDVGVAAPWQRFTDEELLAHLPRVAEATKMVEAHLKVWVAEARQRNLTWAMIGAALGMTRQSAWERFNDPKG